MLENVLAVALRPRTALPHGGRERAGVPKTSAIRVLVADDSPATRLGLRALLNEWGFDVCAEADDTPTAVDAATRERPDVCLLEIRMAGDGIGAIAEIVAAVPATAVVVVTAARDDAEALQALRAGASGYVFKHDDPEGLAFAIHAAARGEALVPHPLLARLLEESRERDRRRRRFAELPLTIREEEVLELLRQGRTTAEIAARLFVSQVTVRTHICSIFKKLDVHDREAAVRLFADQPLELETPE